MAVRRRRVEPDLQLETQTHGPVPVVSREAVMEAVADAVAVQDMAGGIFSVLAMRHPTDMPNEMVTTSVVIEWRDRTDAKPQPEQAAPKPEPVAAPIADPSSLVIEGIEDEPGPNDNPDGFDYDALEDEDVAEQPEQVRA
jgi:hypothetical protein